MDFREKIEIEKDVSFGRLSDFFLVGFKPSKEIVFVFFFFVSFGFAGGRGGTLPFFGWSLDLFFLDWSIEDIRVLGHGNWVRLLLLASGGRHFWESGSWNNDQERERCHTGIQR